MAVTMNMLPLPGFADQAGFYKNPHGLFSSRPEEKKSEQNIKRFGPVGLSIDLVKPAFGMRVAGVEEGSPAAATGKFAKGQIIESVNGEVLKEIDPRVQMGRWVEQVEAGDGKLTPGPENMLHVVVSESLSGSLTVLPSMTTSPLSGGGALSYG